MEKKSHHEILVIGRDLTPEMLTRSEDPLTTRTDGPERALSAGMVSVSKLKDELDGVLANIGGAIEKVNEDLGNYRLDEIAIKLELTTSGKIGILGSGVSASGTGGIELTFKWKG